MRFSTPTLLYRAGPLAAVVLFAGFALPHSSSKVATSFVIQNAHLDIKPGSCPNPVNVNFPDDLALIDGVLVSVIPVSILGNKFDIEQVNIESIQMTVSGSLQEAPVFPIQIDKADTGTPFVGEDCECHDLAGDGLLDIDLKFDKQQVVEAFGLREYEDGAFVELKVTGGMKGGFEFVARDCIRIINH